MRSILFALVLLVANASPATAQSPAAPYQRLRTGAEAWNARGGFPHSWHGGYGAFGVAPFFAPPIIAGSWYERPYPYHFDYYRHRWGSAPDGPYADRGVEMTPAAQCPCLDGYPTSPPSTATDPAAASPPSADIGA